MDGTQKMKMDTPESVISGYRSRALSRRELLTRLIAVTGSMAAAHLLLESSGLAQDISEREAAGAGISAADVSYPSGDHKAGGYLCVPQQEEGAAGGDRKFPAVIVIHENRGLNEHTRDVARRFAREGFVALAPDALAHQGGTAG
jgi:carboxymethylenebutenolidase